MSETNSANYVGTQCPCHGEWICPALNNITITTAIAPSVAEDETMADEGTMNIFPPAEPPPLSTDDHWRREFAKAAMQGELAAKAEASYPHQIAQLAEWSFDVADAFLAEAKKREGR